MSTLYLVATPIGNLEDITLRALRILGEVELIAAEDTRRTRILLRKYDIKTPVTSYFEHNKLVKTGFIIEALKTKDVALVSDAGMPAISDPGYELVVQAAREGIRVVPVPGASAVVSALSVSALPTDSFRYIGFLPNRSSNRLKALEELKNEKATIVALEAPHRLAKTLEDVKQVLGDVQIAVCRELTKLHEEIFRGLVSEALKHFERPKGEIVLVISGAKEAPMDKEIDIDEKLKELKKQNIKAKEAVEIVSEASGISKKELYRAWLTLE